MTSKTKLDIIAEIKNSDTLEIFLKKYPSNRDDGFIRNSMYELIIELSLLFGTTDINMEDYTLITGKVNTLQKFSNKNFRNYFNESAISGSSEGVADCKYILKKTNKLILMSVKYYDNEEKSINKYDISPMFHTYNTNSLDLECEYVVICKNHKELKKKIKRAQHENKKKAKDIKKIYGQKHVSKWYRKLKVIFENNTIEQLIDILNIGKETLELRPHQWIIREQVIEMFNNGIKEILINGIPRCGKTYIIGGIIDLIKSFVKHKNPNKILLIGPRPTACKKGYLEMFNKFKEFNKYKIIYLKDDEDYIKFRKDSEQKDKPITFKNNSITILSRQLILDRKKKISLDGLDLVVFDESHLMCTPDAKKFVDELKQNDIKLIHLTGTSQKVEYYYQLSAEKILRFGLLDVIKYQDGEIYNYCETLMKQYMNKYHMTENNVKTIYKKFPKMRMYHGKLNFDDYNNYLDDDNHFSWKKLFALNQKGKFLHKKSIVSIMSKIFINNDTSYVTEIFEDCENLDNPNIILGFLPYGQGLGGIDNLQNNLKNLLEESQIFQEDYECMSFCSKNTNANTDVLQQIEDKRRSMDNHKTLVVLLGSMLELGCSIPQANLVITMHDFQGADKYKQQIFRALTENKNKIMGAILDFNPHRILYNTMNVLQTGNSKTSTEIRQLILKEKMIRVIGENLEIEPIEQTSLETIYEEINDIDFFLTNEMYSITENYDNELNPFSINTGYFSKIEVLENIEKEEVSKGSDYNVKITQKDEEVVDIIMAELDERSMQELQDGIKNFCNFVMMTN